MYINVNHPWHNVPTGERAPEVVNTVIEIPQGSRAKYELDKDSGLLRMDRVIYSSFHYPNNYGFIPNTLGDDHDPLDIMVLSSINIQPLCIVEAKVIGVMQMIDNGEGDDKIIGVALNDQSFNHINNMSELSNHFFNELKHFFEEYKRLEDKKVKVEDFGDKKLAQRIINDAVENYKRTFGRN